MDMLETGRGFKNKSKKFQVIQKECIWTGFNQFFLQLREFLQKGGVYITEKGELSFQKIIENKTSLPPLCKVVIDETISDDEFKFNPGCGKYKIEIEPILPRHMTPLVAILIAKQIYIRNIRIFFFCIRKVIITPDDDYLILKTIQKEYDGIDTPFEIKKASYRAYPECEIQKINLSKKSTINFTDSKTARKWLNPVETAILKYLSCYRNRN